jgi:hypothetical protein
LNILQAAPAVSAVVRWLEDWAMAISTRDLHLLPDVDRLRALLQSVAMLDAILSPEWESRYYSFNSRWSKREQMGSMRDGCGDDFFALFNPSGCFLKGFAHESPMSPYGRQPKAVWPGVLDNVPSDFAAGLKEPAFSIEDTTFCVWRRYSDESWQRGAIEFPGGADPDGSQTLLSILDGKPKTYKAWAEDHYERRVNLAAVKHVYAHEPITQDLVRQLNAEVTVKELAGDIKEIGYPGAIRQ